METEIRKRRYMPPETSKTSSEPADLASVPEFLERQRKWVTEAEEAFSQGYYVETIGICVSQAHALLREGIWLQSEIEARERKKKAAPSIDAIRKLPESAPDRELYWAAERFGIIDEKTGKLLNELYEQKTMLLRDLLLHEDDARHDDILEKVAAQYLIVNEKCLGNLERRFAITEGKKKALKKTKKK